MDANRPADPGSQRIKHPEQTIRPVGKRPQAPAIDPTSDDPLPVAEGFGAAVGKKITAFGKDQRHEDRWNRTPNATGNGAIHVRTFHSKLTDDALSYMDQCINEWLDAHPQYEVKFVNSTVGTVTAKLKEPHLVCQVWV